MVTWYRPDNFMLTGLGIFNILWLYNSYRVWFHTEQEFKKNQEQVNKTPSWFPLKEYFIEIANSKETWSRQTKLTSAIGILFLLFMDAMLILATILGK